MGDETDRAHVRLADLVAALSLGIDLGLARGLSNKDIAQRLVISPRTVGNHIEHIYAKIDTSTRAAAGLFAMRHGLLPEAEFVFTEAGVPARPLSPLV